VPADGVVVGRIMKANAAPVDEPWLWTLAFGHHEDRTPTHGYAATRETTMAAFAKSLAAGIGPRCHWRRRWRVQIAPGGEDLRVLRTHCGHRIRDWPA